MKSAWIKAHRALSPLNTLCEVLEVSINGYRAWVLDTDSRPPPIPRTACRWPKTG